MSLDHPLTASITFTTEGNPDTRPSALDPGRTLINWDKYVKLGRIAADFERFLQPFIFHELDAVQSFLAKALAERGSGSLDALYRKSRECHYSRSVSSGANAQCCLSQGKITRSRERCLRIDHGCTSCLPHLLGQYLSGMNALQTYFVVSLVSFPSLHRLFHIIT